jgi:hypothetical protein
MAKEENKRERKNISDLFSPRPRVLTGRMSRFLGLTGFLESQILLFFHSIPHLLTNWSKSSHASALTIHLLASKFDSSKLRLLRTNITSEIRS